MVSFLCPTLAARLPETVSSLEPETVDYQALKQGELKAVEAGAFSDVAENLSRQNTRNNSGIELMIPEINIVALQSTTLRGDAEKLPLAPLVLADGWPASRNCGGLAGDLYRHGCGRM